MHVTIQRLYDAHCVERPNFIVKNSALLLRYEFVREAFLNLLHAPVWGRHSGAEQFSLRLDAVGNDLEQKYRSFVCGSSSSFLSIFITCCSRIFVGSTLPSALFFRGADHLLSEEARQFSWDIWLGIRSNFRRPVDGQAIGAPRDS